jgi:serine/threonine-protein kinase
VFSAVAHAHAQRILHRDLKPTNLLVEAKTGEPVVVDFGAASFPLPQPQLTDTRLPPGTPRYTSPEARRFANVHRLNPEAHYEYKPADELYALGVTLFDLLTDPLHHSHPQPAPLSELDIPRAHEVNPRVPLQLSQFVTRLLQSEPTKRPVSVEAARRELAEFHSLQSEAWMKWPVHAPAPPPADSSSGSEEARPPPSQAPELAAAHQEVGPEPVSAAAPAPQVPREPPEAPPVAHAQAAEAERVSGPGGPGEPLPGEHAPQRRAVALGALVLGLLVAGGVALSLSGTAHPEPAPAPPAAAPPQPLPQPLVAPPISPSEKGTAMNAPPSSPGSVPSLCAQKQPPPRGTPQWLKWCKCALIVGSLAATQAGCPAVQVRQSLTEECSQESVAAMQRLEVEFYRGPGTRTDIIVEFDVKQPSPGNKPCAGEARACIQDGPLTSRVLVGSGRLVRGTLLSGRVWFPQPEDIGTIRWTEATLPDGGKHPVCIESSAEQDSLCPNGAWVSCAAQEAQIVKRWDRPLNP